MVYGAAGTSPPWRARCADSEVLTLRRRHHRRTSWLSGNSLGFDCVLGSDQRFAGCQALDSDMLTLRESQRFWSAPRSQAAAMLIVLRGPRADASDEAKQVHMSTVDGILCALFEMAGATEVPYVALFASHTGPHDEPLRPRFEAHRTVCVAMCDALAARGECHAPISLEKLLTSMAARCGDEHCKVAHAMSSNEVLGAQATCLSCFSLAQFDAGKDLASTPFAYEACLLYDTKMQCFVWAATTLSLDALPRTSKSLRNGGSAEQRIRELIELLSDGLVLWDSDEWWQVCRQARQSVEHVLLRTPESGNDNDNRDCAA